MASLEIVSNLKQITSGTVPTTTTLANGEFAYGLIGGKPKLYGNTAGVITDYSNFLMDSQLTGAFFVVHSLTKKHSYSETFFGVNSSSYAGFPVKYLKDWITGDPIYDKSRMRFYMKKMTNTEYLPVYGEEIYFYENNGADIRKLYKVQLQELTPGNGELLCFFELGTPAEVFGLLDKYQGVENVDKILGINSEGMVVPVSSGGGGGVSISEEQVYIDSYEWSEINGKYEVTKNISGIDYDSMVWYSADLNSLEAFAEAGVVMTEQSYGQVTFGCKEKPQNQISVIVRWQ